MNTCNCKCNCGEKKQKIAVSVILDKSGSMISVEDATISGFNEYIDTLRKDGNDYSVTLTLFDTEVRTPYMNAPIASVEKLSKQVYQPGGNTALYDAACKTIKELEKSSGQDKSLVVIITDGHENASREYKETHFRDNIQRLEKTGRWTFVYLGANQDAWGNAANWGFNQGNVATFAASHTGASQVFASMGVATRNYAMNTLSATKDFLAEQKDIIETTA